MGFRQLFTDMPLDYKLSEGETLFSISINPHAKGRIEYIVVTWIDSK